MTGGRSQMMAERPSQMTEEQRRMREARLRWRQLSVVVAGELVFIVGLLLIPRSLPFALATIALSAVIFLLVPRVR